MKKLKTSMQFLLLLFITTFCTSCATTVGMAAAAVASATIAVGKAIITAPFKIIGAMDSDDDDDGDETEDRN